MKRYGDLWGQITEFKNLYKASQKAQRGKRFKHSVLSFNYHLGDELRTLQQELIQKIYVPGEYRTFRIFDPKPRLISAAPYRDRVVHHALCNVIEPIIDRTFISDCYANRIGYGTHRALRQFIKFARTSRYVLQCDIRKYFPSIDHEILKQLLRRKIKCLETLWLIDRIIDRSNEQEASIEYFSGDDLLTPLNRRKGLPIGNLTSQFFANVYLNGFDHFVKETLQCSKYLRYVDDFVLFADSHEYLVRCRQRIEVFLEKLRLRIHPIKSQLFETCYGVNFVGFRVMPIDNDLPCRVRVRIRNDNLRRSRRRLRQLQTDYASGLVTLDDVIIRLRSWEAHLFHGNTFGLRRSAFNYWAFAKV